MTPATIDSNDTSNIMSPMTSATIDKLTTYVTDCDDNFTTERKLNCR